VSWIAITTAHVTTEVLISTKSGIEVDLADLPWPLTFDGRDRRVSFSKLATDWEDFFKANHTGLA
jgi:hypothetical protein